MQISYLDKSNNPTKELLDILNYFNINLQEFIMLEDNEISQIIKENSLLDFSRFFSLDAWWEKKLQDLSESVRKTFPFLIVPKASQRERNTGLDNLKPKKVDCLPLRNANNERTYLTNNKEKTAKDIKLRQNNHPTIKPIKLMSYLITLATRENDIVLDPFAGSGTTAIACKLLNRKYIAIEKEKEYHTIAKHRVEASEQYNKFLQEKATKTSKRNANKQEEDNNAIVQYSLF